jgi:hypothetical protein
VFGKGFNLSPEKGYTDWGLSWFSSVPPGECRVSTLNYATSDSFQFTNHFYIWVSRNSQYKQHFFHKLRHPFDPCNDEVSCFLFCHHHHHHMAVQPKSGPGLPFLGFLNNKLFTGLECYFSTQPSTWRTRSPYLWPPETGWPSYTPRHWVPILVTFYDMHGLQCDYSLIPATTRKFLYCTVWIILNI